MFSAVHIHLLLNHVPIILTGLVLVLLAIARWRKDDSLTRVGFALSVVAALAALPTFLTGEGAEEAVEKMPGVTEAIIESHEEIALIAAVVVGVLGAFTLLALWRYRRPATIPRLVVQLALAGALVGGGLMGYTGLLGGRIRHTEVRPDYVPAAGDHGLRDQGVRLLETLQGV